MEVGKYNTFRSDSEGRYKNIGKMKKRPRKGKNIGALGISLAKIAVEEGGDRGPKDMRGVGTAFFSEGEAVVPFATLFD